MQLWGNCVQLPSDFCECISQIVPILQYCSLFIAKHCSQSFSLWDTQSQFSMHRGGTELSVKAVSVRLFLASYHQALEMGTQGWSYLWKAPLSTPLEPHSAITITLDTKHTLAGWQMHIWNEMLIPNSNLTPINIPRQKAYQFLDRYASE